MSKDGRFQSYCPQVLRTPEVNLVSQSAKCAAVGPTTTELNPEHA